MSIYRSITRLAVVSALNNYMQEPWPTLAGPNIFDSKIEPVEDMAKDRVFPCCVVYTDYDKDHINRAMLPHKDRLMTVTLELLIVQVEASNHGPYTLECPATDSEIEMSLDLFEVQIFRALASGSEASNAFNYLCPGAANVISRRGASIEGGQRLAARQITIETKAVRDNVSGTIPADVETFLNRLEQHDDYADRVTELRQMIADPAGWTPGRRKLGTFGGTTSAADWLSQPVPTQTILPPNITYLNQSGGPL